MTLAVVLSGASAYAQKISTGTFTGHLPGHFAPPQAKQPQTAPNSALAQQRRALIMQQRQDRIQFEQQYRAAMQSLEAIVKGQSPTQQASARAQAQQQWRAKRKALLDTQRQARAALNNQK